MKELDADADASTTNGLGAVAYYLLTGATVFTAKTIPELFDLHLDAVPAPPSSRTDRAIPAALDAVILRCLAKTPGDRPASAAALRAELEALVVPGWTSEDAAAWWRTHRARAPAPSAAIDPIAQTLAVGPAVR